MTTRDLLSLVDWTSSDIERLLDLARDLKQERDKGVQRKPLTEKTFALIFEKPSTRTFVSFTVAIAHLGGQSITIDQRSLGGRESIPDIARTLSRYVDGIIMRTFAHKTIETFAAAASVPVINALTDRFHPCQALADYLTIREHLGPGPHKIVYVGDGYNVANSLILLAAKFGDHIVFSGPPGYEMAADIVKLVQDLASQSGGRFEVIQDPAVAVTNSDVIYTDTWTSMGLEEEAAKRRKDFKAYQVNKQLVSKAKPRAVIMHCLPAHRGEEITDEVMDGPLSVVFDQAENRLHVQKAILAYLYR